MIDLLTVDEVAAQYRVSVWTIYKLVKAGRLQACRVGFQLRFRPQDVESYLEGQSSVTDVHTA